MRVLTSRSRKATRWLASLTLVLWLGGVGCLFGCETGAVTAAPAGPHAFAQAESSCPMTPGHGCCHAQKGEADGLYVAARAEQAVSATCCPLAGQSAIFNDKPRVVDWSPTALVAGWGLPAAGTSLPAGRPGGAPNVLDRGGTYLRCCVFLI